jgi:molecular chaperone GrpE (heat shock protein)
VNFDMARGNGNSEVDPAELDPARELPSAEDTRDGVSATGQGTELDKLKAERDLLLDRQARLQAEFENARSRTSANLPSPTR